MAQDLERAGGGGLVASATTFTAVELTVNGRPHVVQVEPRALLVHVLREQLALTGTKIGCDSGRCGACTVHLAGRAVKSCTLLAVQADGAEITTIEGVGARHQLDRLQRAFVEEHALQCGYCTPGMIMSALELVADGEPLSDEEIASGLSGNLCRCTGYASIVRAVRRALAQGS